MNKLFKIKWFYIIFYLFIVITIISTNKIRADQEIRIIADEIIMNKKLNSVSANGNAVAIDKNGVKIKSDKIEYNEKNEKLNAFGNVIINDTEKNTYFVNKLTSENGLDNLVGSNVKVRMKDRSRIVGSNIVKKNNISVLTNAEYTPCLEEEYLISNCPGWKLKSKRIYHNNDTKTISYDHARIHMFNVPVFYLPYFSHPDPSVKKRSGFLMPTVETDQNLGDTLSLPIFYNLSPNYDITFTPKIQSKSNNFYSLNYRHLNKSGNFNVDASIDDNDDKSGTSNHIFIDAKINNSIGDLNTYIQTTNNDTYMRKNKINRLTVLKSGFDFETYYNDNYFSLNAAAYKHLTDEDGDQWEYLYPDMTYNINNIEDTLFNGNLSLENKVYLNKDRNDNDTSLISSQVNWNNGFISHKNGLVFENKANLRAVSVSIDNKDSKDISNIRLFPQIESQVSIPLYKVGKNYNQTVTPKIMPILAPYNNYTASINVSGSNLFSSNRANSLSEWESGPRINYGIDWFIEDNSRRSIKFTLGQSATINKEKNNHAQEISDYFLSTNASYNKNYLNSSIVVDRKDIDLKSLSINTYTEIHNLKFKIDYDYSSEKYSDSNEQIAIGGEYKIYDKLFLKFTGTKDIDSNKNIGYQYGLLYEDNCLGIDLNYYRDLTVDRDIRGSDGYSFTVVLKPFGSTNNYGKNKIFGPRINE